MGAELEFETAVAPVPRRVEQAFRVGIVQFRPRKADYHHNLSQIGALFHQIVHANLEIEVLVLPETALSGYFLQGGVREVAVSTEQLVHDLALLYAQVHPERPLDICVGFYELEAGKYYNSALYATLEPDPSLSRLLHLHRKFFLPTYGVFEEKRFVSRGRHLEVFQTRFCTAAVLICEDVWHSISATLAALKGAQVLYVPTASPARGFRRGVPENVLQYRCILTRTAQEHGVYVVQSSLVGFEGGKGFIGASMLVDPFGQILLEGPLGEEALLIGQIALDDIAIARAQSPLLPDLESVIADVLLEMQKVVESRGRSL